MGIGHMAIDHFKRIQKKKRPGLSKYWPDIKSWINSIDNWAHGDMIASIYSSMLEEDPKKIYPTLVKWSKDKNPWKRRMSIVSLIYYFRCRNKVLPYNDIIKLLEPQLNVDHYYVQKAVGWTLRELTQAYPKETDQFLNENHTQISSTAFSAAVEKISKAKKRKIKGQTKRISKRLPSLENQMERSTVRFVLHGK